MLGADTVAVPGVEHDAVAGEDIRAGDGQADRAAVQQVEIHQFRQALGHGADVEQGRHVLRAALEARGQPGAEQAGAAEQQGLHRADAVLHLPERAGGELDRP